MVSYNDLGEICGAALQQYLDCAQTRYNINTNNALELADISVDDVLDTNTRVKGAKFQHLLLNLIELSEDPVFGLRTSAFIQAESYSIMGFIAMNSATLADALAKTIEYEKLVGDMGTTTLEPYEDGMLKIRWSCCYDNPLVRRHLIDNILASWVRYAKWMSSVNVNPVTVLLEHEAPDDKNFIKEYELAFGCPVLFSQSCSAIVVTPAHLATSARRPDKMILDTLVNHATERMAVLGEISLSHKVRETIRRLIEEGLPRKELIADALGLTTRTLHRKLQEENTSYQLLLDDLRRSMSMGFLTSTELNQRDIANKVGFSDVRSFQQSFRKWAHMTPGEFRELFKNVA